MPTKQLSRETRALRAVMDNPALPALIQSLPARDLAQLCGRVGIGDAMHIMALAPPERLVQALEASVWKTPRPGVAEVFDTRELIEWIWAWLDIGESFTAQRLAAVPDENLMLYLSQLATVTSVAMWGFERSTEVEDLDRIYAPSYDETAYGPYVVSARHQDDWETLRDSLDAMWSDAPQRLLHLLAQLVGDESMVAPQRNRENANEDVVAARDTTRERCGYVTASGARAFLIQARRPLEELVALEDYDLETRRHLAGLADDQRSDTNKGAPDDSASATPAPQEAQLVAMHAALEEAGLLEPPPERLLLRHDSTSRQLPIGRLLQELAQKDGTQFDARGKELAYLSSVLVAGITVEGAALSPEQARNAALATCNLGLETLRSHGERVRIDHEPGLVRLFLVGFAVLGTLPVKVAQSFARSLKALRKANPEPLHEWLVEQAEVSVAELNETVRNRNFEAAREATLALGFVFEPRTCRAIAPLLDELPRLGAVDSNAVTWIDSVAAVANAAQLLRDITAKTGRRR
jgi:Family of unknown function (DUF6178)